MCYLVFVCLNLIFFFIASVNKIMNNLWLPFNVLIPIQHFQSMPGLLLEIDRKRKRKQEWGGLNLLPISNPHPNLHSI